MSDGVRITDKNQLPMIDQIVGIKTQGGKAVGPINFTNFEQQLLAGEVGSQIDSSTEGLNHRIDETTADLQAQVDEIAAVVAAGTRWVDPVAYATTTNITLSGEQSVDSGAATSSSRVLVKDHATGALKGIYVSAAGAWSRSSDANDPSELVGLAVFVTGGSVNGGKQFICTTPAPIVVGTTALTFREFSNQTAMNANLATVQAGLPKKSRLQNLFTNGNLDPDGPSFKLFEEWLTTNSSYNARSGGTVVIPIANTIINGLGCNYVINAPPNATSIGNRGNKLTQNVNIKGGGIYFSVLVYSYAGAWDFGATGYNSPLGTIRYLDGSAATNIGLTTYEAVGTNVRRYYGYVALTAGKVASRIELGLDSAPPRADRFGFTGFWASATTESGLAIGDTEYPDWRTKRNFPFDLRNRVAVLEASSTLQRFVAALCDDMHSISAVLPGDSLTWGRTASGNSAYDPRTGDLTDPRNTIDEAVSPSWPNLLTGFLVRAFCQGAISSPAPGVAQSRKTVIGDICYDNVRFKVQDRYTGGVRIKDIDERLSGPLLLRNLDIPNTGTATDTLVFNFTGDNFTVVYATQTADAGATYTVEVDGVIVGSAYSHYAAVSTWGHEEVIPVAFGPHRVRIWNNSATQDLRLEVIKFSRLLRIRNQGIIGRDTGNWLPTGDLYPGINSEDEFVIMMLGTNDRVTIVGEINAGQKIRDNLKVIGTQLAIDGKTLILMTPPRATTDWPGSSGVHSFDTQEAAMAVRQAATDLNVSVIDNYAATAIERTGALLDIDGLHLNDAGQRTVFNNIVTSLRLAGQSPA